MNVAAIILAAGESSRMGRPKPLLPIDGTTFLGYLLQQLQASRVSRTVVVLGYRPHVVLDAMPQVRPLAVVNPNYSLGQLSSLHVGLEAVADGADAILLCLADHPFISAELLDQLIEAHQRTHREIIIPTYGGARGHPVLFAGSLFAELKSAALDQGARAVVRAHAADVLELATGEAGVVGDVDTPEQYEQWLAYWRSRPSDVG